jgi:hypothetical protein
MNYALECIAALRWQLTKDGDHIDANTAGLGHVDYIFDNTKLL